MKRKFTSLKLLLWLGLISLGLWGCSLPPVEGQENIEAQPETSLDSQEQAYADQEPSSDQDGQLEEESNRSAEEVSPSQSKQSRQAKKKKKGASHNKSSNGKSSSAQKSPTQDSKDAEASSRSQVRLATWNLHDYFDSIDDSYNDEVLSPQEYQEKTERLATVLKIVDADIIGVEEVEKEQCLKDLGQRSGYQWVKLIEGNDHQRGINVGVLSRLPLSAVVSHRHERFSVGGGRNSAFSRDCLEVHFKHPSNFTLLVNHLKSMRGDSQSNDYKRLAQATRLKEIAYSLKKYPLAICGDLNSEPEAPSLAPLLKANFLTDVLGNFSKNQRLTFVSKRYHSALDYILVNDKLKTAVVNNSARVWNLEEARQASDHRPVSVDLDLSRF